MSEKNVSLPGGVSAFLVAILFGPGHINFVGLFWQEDCNWLVAFLLMWSRSSSCLRCRWWEGLYNSCWMESVCGLYRVSKRVLRAEIMMDCMLRRGKVNWWKLSFSTWWCFGLTGRGKQFCIDCAEQGESGAYERGGLGRSFRAQLWRLMKCPALNGWD